MKIKISEKIIDAVLFIFLVTVVFFFNPMQFSKWTGYYFINETVHALIFYVCSSLLLAGFILRSLIEKHKDFVMYLINRDFLKSTKLRKELALIKNAHSHINRKELAKLMHSHKAIKIFNHRVKFDYEHVCVTQTIRVDKLYKEVAFRQTIAKAIAHETKKIKIDMIISSNTGANNMLSSTVMEATGIKHYYFYNVSAQTGIHLISSPDLRSFRSLASNKINILVVESIMLTPKIAYQLAQFIETVAEETDKIIRLVGIGVVFNGYNKESRRAFSEMNFDKAFDLFKVNVNLLPASDCPACYLGGCSLENFVAKNYIIPYA